MPLFFPWHPFVRRLLPILGVILLAAGLFWSSEWLRQVFFALVGSIESVSAEHRVVLAGVFVVLAAVSALLSFFTSVPLVPPAVVLFGSFGTFILLLTGWMLGGMIAYGAGLWAGHPLVERFQIFQRFEEFRRHLSARSDFLMAWAFRLGLPSETGYVFGITGYPFLKYLAVTFLSEAPFAWLAVEASDALLAQEEMRFLLLVLLASGLVAIAGTWFYQRFRRR